MFSLISRIQFKGFSCSKKYPRPYSFRFVFAIIRICIRICIRKKNMKTNMAETLSVRIRSVFTPIIRRVHVSLKLHKNLVGKI